MTLFAGTWWFGRIAVDRAWEAWSADAGVTVDRRLLRAVEEGTAAVELDQRVDSVGVGGLPNDEGVVELDAGLMEGRSMEAGAVGGVRGVVPAIELARHVLDDGRHLLLVGEGAERFAAARGMRRRELLTAPAAERYRRRRETGGERPRDRGSDTVGLIGWHEGHLVVGCATSGLAWKRPGRVGDSPVVGGGLYADDEAGAAVCTGVGEEIWRSAMAIRVVDAMAGGAPAEEAVEGVVRRATRRRQRTAEAMAGVIAVRADGDHAAAATRRGFKAMFCVDGQTVEADPPPPEG